MANRLQQALGHIRRLIDRRPAEQSDGALLECFLTRQDESAFAALVERHGPLVLGVCRRVLQNTADAEDAFQVTFLTLAARARALRHQQALASWLYRVAYRIALRARTRAARRRAQEQQAFPMQRPDAQTALDWQELGPVLDEELNRLPEKLRAPLVLCALEGKTNEQAALELGWPVGSISKRLARARTALSAQLARRGFALSAAALAVSLADRTLAAVPGPLLQATVRAALPVALGTALPAGALSTSAAALFKETLRTSAMTRLRIAIVVLLGLGLLGTGTGALLHWASAGARDAAPAARADAPEAGTDQYGDPLPPRAVARLGTVRWRHGGFVPFAGFADNGKRLVTASSDGYFRLWDIESGKELRRFALPRPEPVPNENGVSHYSLFTLADDGSHLAAVNADGAVHVWEVASGKEVRRIAPNQAGVNGVALDAAGQVLAIRDKAAITVHDLATGKETQRIAPWSSYPHAFGSGDNLLSFRNGARTLASISRDGDQVKQIKRVRLWDVASGKVVGQVQGQQEFADTDQVLSPDGKLLATSSNGTILLHEVATSKEVQRFEKVGPCHVAFAPDSATLAAKVMYQGVIRRWDVATGKERAQLVGGMEGYGAQRALSFSPDGSRLVEGTFGGTFRLWDLAAGKEIQPFRAHQGGVAGVGMAADGKSLTTLGADGLVRVWDARTGAPLRQARPAAEPNVRLALDPTGQVVAFGAANLVVRLWDVAADKELRSFSTIDTHRNATAGVGGLVFTADGKRLVVRGYDPSIYFHDVATGKEQGHIAHQRPTDTNRDCGLDMIPGAALGHVYASTDFRLLATVEDPFLTWTDGADQKRGGRVNRIRLWNGTTCKEHRTLLTKKHGMETLAFSPDHKTLAAANADGTISLWETATGKERGELPVPTLTPTGPAGWPIWGRDFNRQAVDATPRCLTFSPDSRTLAAGYKDGTIRFWSLPEGKETGRLSGHQGAILTLVFTPDGKLVSGSADTTALVWDVGALLR